MFSIYKQLLVTCSLSLPHALVGLDPPDGGEHDVAEALAKCIANTKLREVQMKDLPPLPVMKTSAAREAPLEKLKIFSSQWVC